MAIDSFRSGCAHSFALLFVLFASLLMLGSVGFAATSITVDSPDGSEYWSGTQDITWTIGDSISADRFTVRYSPDSGSSWTDIATGLYYTARSYSWNTNDATTAKGDSNNYLIQVVQYIGGTQDDVSDAVFTVDNTVPTIAISDDASTTWTNSDTISVTVSDSPADIAETKYIINSDGTCDSSVDATLNSGTSGTSVTADDDTTYQNNYICFRTTDNAGNKNYAVSTQITMLDTTAPSVPDASKITITMNNPGVEDTIVGIAGSVEGSSVVSVYKESSLTNLLGSITAAADGSFSAFNIGDNQATSDLVYIINTDAANNPSASTSKTNDITAPSAPIVTLLDPINIANEKAVTITGTGEASASLSYSIDDTNGGTTAITGTSSVDGSDVISVTGIDVSNLDDDTLTVSVTLTDAAGNAESADTDTATKDTVKPTVIVASATADPTNGLIAVTAEFSEDVTSFVLGDITVTNGVVADFVATDGDSYTFNVNPTDGASIVVIINVAANVAIDAAINNNLVSNTLSYISDTTAPTVAITAPTTGTKVKGTATVSFTDTELTAAQCSIDDAIWVACTSGATTLSAITGFDALEDVSFTLYLKDTDTAGNVGTDSETGIIKDTTAPTLTITTAPTSPSNTKTGLVYTFTFSEDVTGFAVGDITLAFAGADADTVDGSSFTGSGNIYILTLDGTDLTDLGNIVTGQTVVASVDMTGLTDIATNAGEGATANTWTYDVTAPTVTIGSDDMDLNKGDTALITFTLSETSVDFIEGDVTVAGGALSSFTGSGVSYTATFTPTDESTTAGTVDIDATKFTDAAGNANTAAPQLSMTVDTVAPTISSVALGSDEYVNSAEATSGVNIVVSTSGVEDDQTVTCSVTDSSTSTVGPLTETVTGNSVTISTGSLSTLLDGSLTASCDVSDAAGNPATTGTDTATKDTSAPTVAITAPTTGTKVKGTAIVSFTDDEITAAQCSIDNSAWVVCTSDTTTLSAITGFDALEDESFTLYLKDTDTAGNVGTDSETGIIKDTTVPTISSVALGSDEYVNSAEVTSGVDIAVLTSGVEDGQTVTCSVTDSSTSTVGPLTETVTGNSVTISTGSLSTLLDGSLTASCDVSDAAGNPATIEIDTATKDTSAPTISISTDDDTLNKGDDATITFTLSETSVDFIEGDVTVAGGALSSFTGSGVSYTATFTPTDESTIAGTIDVAAGTFTDAAGNANTAAPQLSMTVDTVAPTITIGSDDMDLNKGDTALITFTLSETSVDFIEGGVTVAGGALSSFTGSGVSYTATFTPTDESTTAGTVDVDATKFTDAAGNVNTAAPQLSMTVDTVAPTITIGSDDMDLNKGNTALITFTLSETSVDFIEGDVTVAGGALSAWTPVNEISYTATFTPTDESTTAGTVNVDATKFTDAAGNANTAAPQLSMTVDTVAPTISSVALGSDEYVNSAEATSGVNIVVSTSGVEDSQTVTCLVSDGSATTSDVTGTVSSDSVTITTGSLTLLNDGSLTANCDVFDAAGNPAITGTDTATKDTVAPTILTVALDSDEYINSAEAINGVDITVSTSGVEDDQILTCSVSDSSITTSDVTGTVLNDGVTIATGFLTSLSDSLLTASCDVSDAAGNPAITGTDDATKDTSAPSITNIASDKDPAMAGDVLTITFDVDETLIVSPTVNVEENTATYVSDAGTIYTYTYTVLDSEFEGDVTVAVTAIDVAGNIGTASITDLTLDFTAPSITDITGDTMVQVEESTLISATITDLNGIDGAILYYTLPDTSETNISMTASGDTYTATIPAIYENGTITYYIKATDNAGNTAIEPNPDTYTVTVYDLIFDMEIGWNLISVPTTLEGGKLLEEVFTDATNTVWTYRADEVLQWVDADKNDFDTGYGYWVNYDEGTTVGVNYAESIGTPGLSFPEVQLAQGWNLIGTMTQINDKNPTEMVLASLIEQIEFFDEFFAITTQSSYDIVLERNENVPGGWAIADEMEPGIGYWIFMNQEDTYINMIYPEDN